MNAGVSYLIVCASVFLATLMLVLSVYSAVRQRAETVGRVNKRTRKLASGKSESETRTSLRRTSTTTTIGFVPQPVVNYLEGTLIQTGMNLSVQRLVLVMAGATLLIAILFPLLAGLVGELNVVTLVFLLVAAASVGVGGPMFYLSRKAAARTKKLQTQFPIALDVFVRGLRAGHPINSALELLVSEIPDPTIGFAAMARGEYALVETYFSSAMQLNPEFDHTAWANLVYAKQLAHPTFATEGH